MRSANLVLFAGLAWACTDGRTHAETIRDEPQLVAISEPIPAAPESEPESEPEPAPRREPTACGTLPSMNERGQLGDIRFTLGLAYPTLGLSRQQLTEGMRWQCRRNPPDGPSVFVTVAAAELATPETLDEARSRIEPLDLDELHAATTQDGLLFVRSDPRRTTLAVDYFTTLGDRAVLCTARLAGDAPIVEFRDERERLQHACTSLRHTKPRPNSVGNRGRSQRP